MASRCHGMGCHSGWRDTTTVLILLIVCYAIAVLSINAAVVLLNSCASVYTRACYALGHLYIGHGQHSVLRIALGVIETLSGAFRSVSLSLRIVCNAVAGHVLLAVLVEMSVTAWHYVPWTVYGSTVLMFSVAWYLHTILWIHYTPSLEYIHAFLGVMVCSWSPTHHVVDT